MPSARRRLNVSLDRRVALRLHRTTLRSRRLVYVIVQDRKINYATGRSRVAYIGTTGVGAKRIGLSAAFRAPQVFAQRGVEELEVRIVTCQSRTNVRSWTKLERALLLTFREMHGEPPICNVQGLRMKETDEFDYFSPSRLRRILEDLA